MNPTAFITEIFSSIQGEGLYVGRRQVFVRFSGCNLACRYCDTAASREAVAHCRVEPQPGAPADDSIPNPVSPDGLDEIVTRIAGAARHHSISLTGGEPLLHADFIRAWLLTRKDVLPVHLETNGTLSDALVKLIGLIDVIAMDIKLPSVTGQEFRGSEHLRFLQVATARTEVFVKMVFGESTPESELADAARILTRVNHAIPVVLQPVTGPGAPDARHVLACQSFLSNDLPNVLVIPQTHKMLMMR